MVSAEVSSSTLQSGSSWEQTKKVAMRLNDEDWEVAVRPRRRMAWAIEASFMAVYRVSSI